MFPCWKKNLYFYQKKAIKERGFSNFQKRKVSYKDHVLSSSLRSKGFDVDEEINNIMNGTSKDKSNGYMCNISNDSNNDGILEKGYFYFMNEGWNEERNNEVEQKQVDNENGRRNFHIPSKVVVFGKVWNVSLWMILGCLLDV